MSDRLRSIKLFTILIMVILLAGCNVTPPVKAQDRLFLPLSLTFLGEYQLPATEIDGIPLGGLSGITYNSQKNEFFAISDDRSNLGPARFYTLDLDLNKKRLEQVTVTNVTFLQNNQGENYTPGDIDPEGISLSPRETVYIASEGVPSRDIAPFIQEYNLVNGQIQSSIPIPQRYFSSPDTPVGMAENKGFESLCLQSPGLAPGDPFRLFTATEYSLIQDFDPSQPPIQAPIRLMHYVVNSVGSPILVAEHLYLLEPDPTPETLSNGLTELLALPQPGYFLSLERTFGLTGFGAKIFQVAVADALDISGVESLAGDFSRVQPVRKQLLLDLSQLDIELDNLEGMTLGPRLTDGSQSLIVVSDDNFREEQVTQFLLFSLRS